VEEGYAATEQNAYQIHIRLLIGRGRCHSPVRFAGRCRSREAAHRFKRLQDPCRTSDLLSAIASPCSRSTYTMTSICVGCQHIRRGNSGKRRSPHRLLAATEAKESSAACLFVVSVLSASVGISRRQTESDSRSDLCRSQFSLFVDP
jgi:hypothetical protein